MRKTRNSRSHEGAEKGDVIWKSGVCHNLRYEEWDKNMRSEKNWE